MSKTSVPKLRFSRYLLIENSSELKNDFKNIIERKVNLNYPICEIEFELCEILEDQMKTEALDFLKVVEKTTKKYIEILIESKKHIPLVNNEDLYYSFIEIMKNEYRSLLSDLKLGIAKEYFGSKIKALINFETIKELEEKLDITKGNPFRRGFTKIDLYANDSEPSYRYLDGVISILLTEKELSELEKNMDFINNEPTIKRELQHRFCYRSHLLSKDIMIKKVLPKITIESFYHLKNQRIRNISELNYNLSRYYIGLG